MSKQKNEPAAEGKVEDIRAMIRKAEKGDRSTLPALRDFLGKLDDMDAFGGALARTAEASLIRNAVGDNFVLQEALKRKLELLRAELAGPNPTPLECLLAERVAACWLQIHDADTRIAQHQGDWTLRQSEFHHRNRDRAHARYLSAIKTLATVRKLAAPVLQVNIARKQVNVAGPVVDATKETP